MWEQGLNQFYLNVYVHDWAQISKKFYLEEYEYNKGIQKTYENILQKHNL